MRLGVLRFAIAVAVFVLATPRSGSQEGQPNAQNTSASGSADAQSLQAYLDSVGKAKQEAQRAWDALRASTQSQGGAAESDFVTEWLAAASTNGAGASPFYAGTEALLKSWIAAIQSGQDVNPPVDEIRAAMQKWQDAHAGVLDSLQQAAALEKTLRALNARIAKMKPESDEWLFYKDQQQQQQLTQRKLLSDAGSALAYAAHAADFPPPITDADRTPSPFAGETTPGTPDRLFLHLRRASALIGESIAVQIGFANDRGPNVAADEAYSVALSCDGCKAQKTEVTIRKSERFTQTEITITAATAHITARLSPHRPPVQANAYGCYPAPSVMLAAEQDRSTGPADGVTPIPFRFAFHDTKGQRATDGRRKYVAPQLKGVGQIVALDQSVASVRAKEAVGLEAYARRQRDPTAAPAVGGFIVPADECVAVEGVASSLVGTASVSAEYNSRPVGPLEFRFLYAFPWLDRICIALGVLFGFIANFKIMQRRHVHWIAVLFSSILGALIVFAAGYYLILNSATVEDTWIIVLGLATIGGVLGVSAAKLVLGKFLEPADSGEGFE